MRSAATSATTRRGRTCSSGRSASCSSAGSATTPVRGIVLTDALIGTFTHAQPTCSPTAASCTTSIGRRHRALGRAGRRDGHRVAAAGRGGRQAGRRARHRRRGGRRLTTDGERATVHHGRRPHDHAPVRCSPTSRPAVLERLLGRAADGAAPGGRPGQGQHAAVAAAAPARPGGATRSRRSPGRSTSTRATRQLEPAYRQAAAGAVPERRRRARSTATR